MATHSCVFTIQILIKPSLPLNKKASIRNKNKVRERGEREREREREREQDKGTRQEEEKK